MKKAFIVMLLLFSFKAASAADKYWIAIGGDSEGTKPPIVILQIDADGNVTKSPVAAIPRSAIDGGENVAALAFDPRGNLIVWAGDDDAENVIRFILDKNTLAILKRKAFSSQVGYVDFLQATQPTPRFIAFDKPAEVYKGFPTDSNGASMGSPFRLVPRYEGGGYHDGTISADGRMAVLAYEPNSGSYALVVQPLDANGRPQGIPVVKSQECLYDLDVSNLLPNGRRFVAYTDCSGSNDVRVLQAVDGSTGALLGGVKLLDPREAGEGNQSVAIDPLGRFVIYDVDSTEVGCPSGQDPLFFLKLNPSTGEPAGTPKRITACDLYGASTGTNGQFGIDILRIP
jgi:hypothetical protein